MGIRVKGEPRRYHTLVAKRGWEDRRRACGEFSPFGSTLGVSNTANAESNR
jgi:hypothetical protein